MTIKPSSFRILLLIVLVVVSGSARSRSPSIYYKETDHFAAPGNVEQMVYAEQYGKLIVRNSGSALRIIDVATKAVFAPILAYWGFSDMDLSPDGRYLFAADYGGENIGYGTPANIHRVLRIDLSNGTYQSKMTSAIAGRVEAVSSEDFILSSIDQWITFTYNEWGTTNVATTVGQPFYAWSYHGSIEYMTGGRLLHGNSGSSSQEIAAFRVDAGSFFRQESSGTYGSASGHGPSTVLSQDQEALYYGRLKVEALDVKNNLKVFGEPIYAATAEYAFGATFYYDAATGEAIDALGLQTTIMALGATEPKLWAFDDATDTIHLYEPRQRSRLAQVLQRLRPHFVPGMTTDETGLIEAPLSLAVDEEMFTGTVSAVPEPRAWMLILVSFVLLCVRSACRGRFGSRACATS